MVSPSCAVQVDPADKNQHVFINVTATFKTVRPCPPFLLLAVMASASGTFTFYMRVGLSQLF